eukprot:604742_1
MRSSLLFVSIGTLVIVAMVWWELKRVQLDNREYFIWNHGRYSVKPENVLMNGWSQKHLSRWRAYNHGHKRQRKVKEHRKNLNLITLWGLIATIPRSIDLYDYMRAVSYLAREKWDDLEAIIGPLNPDNDKM